MGDIKALAKNEKELEALITNNENIHPGMKIGIEKCAMFIMKSGKRKAAEGIEHQNQESIITLEEKENYENLGILGIDTIK